MQGEARGVHRDPDSEWLPPTLAWLVVVALLGVWWATRPAPSAAAPPLVPSVAAGEDAPEAPASGEPEEKAVVPARGPPAAAILGGGWYAVPPSLAGRAVRFVDGVLEVEGQAGSVTPMACLVEEAPLKSVVSVAGQWSLSGVGGGRTKGGRVALRLLDSSGRLAPAGTIEGGSQRFLAQGRGDVAWTAFEGQVEPAAGVVGVRLCVDNRAGTGVVRVKSVRMRAQ